MIAAYALFDTAFGRCGIAWRADLVTAFALPGDGDEATLVQLTRKAPGTAPSEPPPAVQEAIRAVQRLLAGEAADLTGVEVDLAGTAAFEQRVYGLLRQIKRGETITYGELASRAGSPGAARAVGMAMARNPIPVIIPCHRVLAGRGRSGGFSAPGGVATKFRLLQIEQAARGQEPGLFADLPLAIRELPRNRSG